MNAREVLAKFYEVAASPKAMKDRYLAEGRKVILTAPVYTPEEIIHSFGFVPMGAWGADVAINEAKRYFPAFICSIMQTILELGMTGAYEGASAIVIPSLCDSLKVLGQNWKYGVKDIPFIPMTYPQNRKPSYGKDFVLAGYERVIKDIEAATGASFDEAALGESIKVYNKHNALMRKFAELAAKYGQITVADRNAVYKSASFMRKEEHSVLLEELFQALETEAPQEDKTKVLVSGILMDAPGLIEILDDNNMQIAWDDVAAWSRQYATDACECCPPLVSLAGKFVKMDNCSVLYDPSKKRIQKIVEDAKANNAKGVILVLTKFCDPEEFDNPLIKKACNEAGLPCIVVEIDRQMTNYEQARTMIETFKEML